MLSCDQHDYIEIVCMFRYPIKLTMKSGEVLECIALDTLLNDNRDECMRVDVHGDQRLVVLTDITKLDVCVDNPHFKTLSFS